MRSSRLAWLSVVWLVLAAGFFLLPLYAAGEFSLETGQGHYGLSAYGTILGSPDFRNSFIYSIKLAITTVVLEILLMVPTVYWVNLKLPRLRKIIEFIAILPIVVPPIALGVGALRLFPPDGNVIGAGPQVLVFTYVILALPFTYRALDAGFRAIDIRTLTDAAHSLGAGGPTVLMRVIVPNLRSAMLSAALLTFTLVMGEYTISSVMVFTDTFPVYVFTTGESQAQPAAALSIISLALTWFAMLALLFAGRGPNRRPVQVGGTH